MGQSAYLNTTAKLWEVEKLLKCKAKASTGVLGMVVLQPKGSEHEFFYHFQSETPLGSFPCLASWRNSEKELEVLRLVGKKFGGVLQASDYESSWEFVEKE